MSEKRTRWWFWFLLLAAVIAVLLYDRCGLGLGGGGGDDSETETPEPTPLAAPSPAPTTPDAAPAKCQVRVDAAGVMLAGAAVEVGEIAGRCPGGVVLTVTGDARHGDAEAVRSAVREASLDLLDRSP